MPKSPKLSKTRKTDIVVMPPTPQYQKNCGKYFRTHSLTTPSFSGSKYFHLKRTTVSYLGRRLSKHKTTCLARNFEWNGPFGPPSYAYDRTGFKNYVSGQSLARTIATWDKRHLDKCHLRQLLPRIMRFTHHIFNSVSLTALRHV